MTSGTQKWKGATPSFMVNEAVIRRGGIWLLELTIVQWPEYIRLMRIAIIRIIEAVAWVRKYFVAASVDRGLLLCVRIGIADNIFISRPIQTSNQWELNVVMAVPVISVSTIMIVIRGLISTGRV